MKTSAFALLSGLLTFWTIPASALPIHNLTYDISGVSSSSGDVAAVGHQRAGHLRHMDISDTAPGSLDTISLEVTTTGAMNAKELKHQKRNNRHDKTGKRINRDEDNSDPSPVTHFAGTPVLFESVDLVTHNESGNHAISAALAVPDTGSTLGMAGFALALLVAARRYLFPHA